MQKVVNPPANRMMAIEDPAEARAVIRAGEYTGHTAGIAPEFVQGNLCILPKDMALEFAAFCQRNPKPCPLLAVGEPGALQRGDGLQHVRVVAVSAALRAQPAARLRRPVQAAEQAVVVRDPVEHGVREDAVDRVL